MAQEIDEGVAYLRALKRSGSSIAATAAATARDITAPGHSAPDGAAADSTERFQGSEKRRSPRYKCEGSAEMREEGCDVRTWATFTDVSLHGCYVEAQATYPVGTVLHMKLEANGMRLEATGNVRVSYPYLGMGVAFVELSEANRAQLRQMLGQISRPSAIIEAWHRLLASRYRTARCRARDRRPGSGHAGPHRVFRKPPDVNAGRLPQNPSQEPTHRHQGISLVTAGIPAVPH